MSAIIVSRLRVLAAGALLAVGERRFQSFA